MKKITLLIIFLLAINVVSAQIDISITQYDSVSQKGKIRLHNTGTIDYRDLVLSIDANDRNFPGSLLKPGSAILIPVNVAPGSRNVVVKTNTGFTFAKEFSFAKDFDQAKQERERQDRIDEQVKETQKEIQEVQELYNPELKEARLSKGGFNRLWIILPLALIIIFFIFFFLKKPRKPKIKPYQKPIHPPKKTIIMPRKQQSPPQSQPKYRSPVSRVILNKQPKKSLEKPNHYKIATQQTQDVFDNIPKSSNAFDRMPSKNNKDIFDKLSALR